MSQMTLREKKSEADGPYPVADAEAVTPKKGHLERQLKNRHIAMISIGGAIGTGLFLGTATALRHGGPLGMLLGYSVMGTVVYCMMCCVGEMVSYLPVEGGHITLAGRFVDPALSLAMGYNYWYNWLVVLPAELSAAAVLVNYWWSPDQISNAVWISICLSVVAFINCFGAKAYGEAEFWFAGIKVVTIIGLIVVGVIIAAGGGPTHHATGFSFWHNPGAFVDYLGIGGSSGQFLGFWAVLVQASFSFIGSEIVALTAGEARNPRRNIPKAVTGVSFRIGIFYILGTFVIGLLVPSNDPRLNLAQKTAAGSPFVLGIEDAGIAILPSIINFCLLTSAWSAASSDMYSSSRSLYSLAISGQAPRIFARTTKSGLPYYALVVSFLFSLLAYTGVSAGSGKVFGYFADMTSICGLITWAGICFTYVRFRKGVAAQGIDRSKFPFKSPVGVVGAWYAFVMICLVVLFNAWQVFRVSPWDDDTVATFITSYLPIPVFFILFFGAKFYYKSRMLSPTEIDFVTDVKQFEDEEKEYLATHVEPTGWRKVVALVF